MPGAGADTPVPPAGAPSYALVDDVLAGAPLLLPPDTPLAEAAAAMTAAGRGCAAVREGDGFAVLADADVRAWVAGGCHLPADAASLARRRAPVVRLGTSATAALIALLDADVDHVVVVDGDGALRGVVSARDLLVSPTTSSASLHQQLRRAPSVEELRRRAARLPVVLRDATRRGVPSSQVTAVHSALVDAVVQRALELVLPRHEQVDPARLTWLSLGSVGRREAVPSSDLDAAVLLDDDLDAPEVDRYRAALRDVVSELTAAGMVCDEHGANPAHRLFARTGAQWRDHARELLSDPSRPKGPVLVSLLLDARPVHGDRQAPSAREAFDDLRSHPAAMRLLLQQALATRARLPSGWDVLRRREGAFDLKSHALAPVVHLARWAALGAGSTATGTVDRLRAAAGSVVLPEAEASTLVEIVEVLQRLRLRHQLEQLDAGRPPTDVVAVDRLSPIERSVIRQAVREVAAVQRRAAGLLAAAPTAALAGPDR